MTATTLAANLRSTEGKAASAYERMRSRIPKSEPPSARVRTRKVGFSIGGFGFTYTSKDLEMGQGKNAPQPDLASLDPDRDFPGYEQSQSRSRTANTSALNLKRGQSAYAAQVRQHREDSVPRSVLLSVV